MTNTKKINKKYNNKTKKRKLFSEIPIFFVRHGQSQNNVLDEMLLKKLNNGKINMKEFEYRSKNEIFSDPSLTSTGIKDSYKFGKYLKKYLNLKNRKLHIFTSPFKRTLQTTCNIIKPLYKNNYEVVVNPNIYENGGVYNYKNNKIFAPAPCMSADEIKKEFKYDVTMLPKKNNWYKLSFENNNKVVKRAQKLVNFIKSEKFQKMYKNKIVLFVMHNDFIDHVLKLLLNMKNQINKINLNNKSPELFKHPIVFDGVNVSSSLFTINSNGYISIKNIINSSYLKESKIKEI
jgi:broad specificity phosphatase PhoE